MRERYQQQVRLLIRVMPFLSATDQFALKGGTAINFFVRDFPRLSVDIDLTYLPVKSRTDSLEEIKEGVRQIAGELEKRIPGVEVTSQKSGGTVSKLIIRTEDAQIMLEVNTVLRGSIYEATERELSPALQEEFELFAAVKTLSFEDLYAGKLCAALDRQHPRDLYDIRLLLKNEGITEDLRRAFLCYLISHSRPINELLNPNAIDIERLYYNEFEGMTAEVDILDELIDIQEELPKLLLRNLTDGEKEFLMSFKKGDPNWELMSMPKLKKLPGVRWKLMNIRKMDSDKHKAAIEKLENVLFPK
ncbi:MAG: nucleotidyl transferase AbiEii/AbiGii toxin family protein [Balneolaceae bacterium]|nr:MAG: nucleotidyl transferase AbiEii/AbiGii toxin family protein [Balneolaceae bacterium]